MTKLKFIAAFILAATFSTLGFAQQYPSPTFKNVIVNGALDSNQFLTGTFGTQHLANNKYIGSYNADCGLSFCVGWANQMSFGGPNSFGGFVNGYDNTQQVAISNPASNNTNHVSRVSIIRTNTGEGGTGLTPGTARGSYFGIGPECDLQSGAVNVFNCTAAEFDVNVEAGASVLYKSIAQFATKPNDRVAGTAVDTMLWAYDQPNASSPHHKFGLLFGGPDTIVQWPFSGTSTIIGAQNSGGTVNALNGIDFTDVTIGGCAFKSNSYCVGGGGAVAATSSTLTGTTPFNVLHDSSAGANIKRWREIVASGNYFIQTQNDAASVSTNAYQIGAATGVGPQSHTWFTSTVAGTPVTQMTLTSASLAVVPKVTTPAVIATGTPPTSYGTCVVSSFVGGATAGKFTAAAGCAAGSAIGLNFSQTAPNGWACNVNNTAHGNDFNFTPMQTTSNTTQAAFYTIGAPTAGDVFVYSCQGF